jgi:hypothetical protein
MRSGLTSASDWPGRGRRQAVARVCHEKPTLLAVWPEGLTRDDTPSPSAYEPGWKQPPLRDRLGVQRGPRHSHKPALHRSLQSMINPKYPQVSLPLIRSIQSCDSVAVLYLAPNDQIFATFSIVGVDRELLAYYCRRESGGLHGCALLAWRHGPDRPVFTGSGSVSGLLCFVSHLPRVLRPGQRVPRCGSTRRPTGLRLRRGGLRRRGGGLIRRGARRRRAGSCGYRIPVLLRRPWGLPQAPGQPDGRLPLSSGRCTSRVGRRGCARARWGLPFWKVTRTLK